MIELKFIQAGANARIYALAKSGRCEFIRFMDRLKKSDKALRNVTAAMIDRIAEFGPPENRTQFRQLRKNLYEIKIKSVRLFCFYHPDEKRLIIISHGWKKGQKKEQSREIEKAERLRDTYLNQSC